MIEVLKMLPEHLEEMQQHVAAQAPLEACGLLIGKNDRVENVRIVRNAEQSPVRFRMDPQEQYNALMWIEDNDLDLLGIFHSHPAGPETVSDTDIDEAVFEAVHIVWSCVDDNWNARGFWIENKKVTEVELQVIKKE